MTPEERLKMNCMTQPPTPDEWLEKYIHDWFLWNGIAFLAVGVIGYAAYVIALLTK